MSLKLRPGPGKLACQKVDLDSTVLVHKDDGTAVRIYVKTDNNQEAIIAQVKFTAKPWVVDGSDTIINPEYAVDSYIVIGRFTGARMQFDREEYIVLREEDVLLEIIGDLPKTNLDPAGSIADQTDDDDFVEALHGTPPLR